MKSIRVFFKTFFVITGINLLFNYFDLDLFIKDLKKINRKRIRLF